MKTLLSKIKKTVKKNNLFQNGDKVVVAVSGGPDSVALLYLLYELRKEYRFKLYIAHLNHQFRGKEADADARFVRTLAKKLKLPCFIKSVNVPALAKKGKKSPEEMAREIRYAFLREIGAKKNATKIALGHTADDQVETMLMWLLRGAGVEGLTGMPIKRPENAEGRGTRDEGRKNLECRCHLSVSIIRPLLETTREEILNYLKENKFQFQQDATNLQPIYLRNRIRNQLIPLLEKEYNPNIKETLLRTAAILRDELDYFDSAAKMLLSCLWNRERTDCFTLKLSEFRQLDRAILRHIIRQAIQQICGTLSGFGFEHIAAILELAKTGTDGLMLHLPHQLTIRIENDNLCFELGKLKQKTTEFSYSISVPGITSIDNLGLQIQSEIIKPPSRTAKLRLNRNDQSLLDADLVALPLTIRNWQPGDFFIPLGMKGKKKLHDFFIDEKIPRSDRDKIPLLAASNGDILWVVGLRIDERYKVTDITQR
ncbi:MAG: tRNA lysidine(34) synthetase TilS, partial [bacterium]|nr:tRNA lysidine(34) synthetase TilS [bacterium]